MPHSSSAGHRFREALRLESPLQILGVPNAYTAMMARECGFQALYLSGASIANFVYGVPDIGLTSMENVKEEARKILDAVDLPLLVDIDTGWGSALTIQRAIQQFEKIGAAAVHLEDQVFNKRCGHLEGKQLVAIEEMEEKIQAAVEAKKAPEFIVMARTDAYSVEGMEKTIERAQAYEKAGADMLFAEAFTSLEEYATLKKAVKIPLLANLTEFGKTPLYTTAELRSAGVDMALYPLTLARLMNKTAWEGMQTLRKEGSQKGLIPQMQTRQKLYKFLNYA